mmetsp:Transcript_11629/g.14703  ORF Transcript_11629/g.14703 Transcript_11629/m.14703 type:complete len:133 (+) Transcript_11629:831-1229(+)|eukprot:CAMPEP_0170472254 /NCGR_PEP_ID=MMETSP0123-20130129/14314_1 /TAXON_ID=182087 /ORGANISM="Favella ehrenbergii, Strain Fehren 1" /LENGTH=132 /DNA_ID=CAMNT_0010740399 /DNA_START=753 /DNA_END=1151 /DNA_ORIENTATION=+
MVTFYEILQSLHLVSGEWRSFPNQDSEKDQESYHLVRFELETGKKHQIRLAGSFAFGSPIVGDFKHGYDSQQYSTDLLRRSFKYTKLQERKLFEDSILLHSSKLEIPVSTVAPQKLKTFNSDPTRVESLPGA